MPDVVVVEEGGVITPASPNNVKTVTIEEFQRAQEETKRVQSQYAGAQGFGQKEKQRADELNTRLQSTATEYEGKLATALAEGSGFKTQYEQAASELEQARKKLQAFEHGQLVAAKIAENEAFSGLAKLQAKGLLRTEGLDDAQLTEYLTNLSTELGVVSQAAVQNTLRGATPATPTGAAGAAMTSEQYAEEMGKLQPNDSKYKEWEKLYMEALRVEMKK